MPTQQTPPKQDAPILRRIITNFGAITLLRAQYVRQRFSRHTHEDFPVGVIFKRIVGMTPGEYRQAVCGVQAA